MKPIKRPLSRKTEDAIKAMVRSTTTRTAHTYYVEGFAAGRRRVLRRHLPVAVALTSFAWAAITLALVIAGVAR